MSGPDVDGRPGKLLFDPPISLATRKCHQTKMKYHISSIQVIKFSFLITFPVLVFPWAQWRSWDFTDSDRRNEYIKYMDQMLEKCVAAIKPPASQFVILADSDGFSFRHMSRLKGTSPESGKTISNLI
jgi:hypothetical protein